MDCKNTASTCKREYGKFTGEGGEEAGQSTEAARSPGGIVDEIYAAVVAVHNGYQQQIEAHDQVSQSQIGDEERVYLTEADETVFILRYNGLKKHICV